MAGGQAQAPASRQRRSLDSLVADGTLADPLAGNYRIAESQQFFEITDNASGGTLQNYYVWGFQLNQAGEIAYDGYFSQLPGFGSPGSTTIPNYLQSLAATAGDFDGDGFGELAMVQTSQGNSGGSGICLNVVSYPTSGNTGSATPPYGTASGGCAGASVEPRTPPPCRCGWWPGTSFLHP